MSKIKSIIVYILSVLLAFETGLLVLVGGMLMLHDELKKDRKKNKISYRHYYEDREEA